MTKAPQRYHYFDSLRAYALLLGIPIHASLAYGDIDYNWILNDSQHSYLIDIMLNFLRLFRMPLFFVISGFFVGLTINKDNFLNKRTKRLLYPLFVFFILLIVPIKSMWLALEDKEVFYSGEVRAIFSYITHHFFEPSINDNFRHAPNWGHLWFLLYLYLFSLLSYLFKNIIKISLDLYLFTAISIISTFFSYFFMNGHWVDEPFQLYPLPSLLIYYGIFFCFGYFLFLKKMNYEMSLNNTYILLVLGSGLSLGRSITEVYIKLNEVNITNYRLFLNLWSTLSTWTLVLGLIFFFQKKVTKENITINYLVRSSYYIYLIHLPIIIILHIIFYKVTLIWPLKFILVCFISLGLSLLSWEFFVKGSFIDNFLKGIWPKSLS